MNEKDAESSIDLGAYRHSAGKKLFRLKAQLLPFIHISTQSSFMTALYQ